MALIEQQDVIYLVAQNYRDVPDAVKSYLETYPEVRIVSQQVINHMPCHIYLVVETV